MAKRVPPDEKPYRPLDEELARSVLLRRKQDNSENQRPNLEIVPPLEAQIEDQEEPPKAPGKQPIQVLEEHQPRKATGEGKEKTEGFVSRRKTLVREKRMLLTEQEEELFQDFLGNIRKNLGVKVNTSNLLRASLALLLHSERELLKQCRRVDYMRKKRPRNDQPTEIAAFEENLARLFDSAIRNSKPLQ